MASAEKLLHEAQYAFYSISYGESPGNRRNKARAGALAKKILRKYPGTTEASEAMAILRRLGEVAYTSEIRRQHRHVSAASHHRKQGRSAEPLAIANTNGGTGEQLDWAGLLLRVTQLSKAQQALILFLAIVAFGIFGPFLLLPLVVLVVFASPLRKHFKTEFDGNADEVIRRINQWIAGDMKTR